ncbi:MAG: UMP kinase [Syntrophales bacterium]|jgi:uridylate kinase|nr:UMP kinase [Syntrophales bacterium]MDY0043794.1 UMP kinase [Syntrophales bacterium]
MEEAAYKRVLLKLSGEFLLGSKPFGIDTDVLGYIADEIRSIMDMGIEIGIVIGGGNIYRGVEVSSRGIDRASADNMGMLATVMNSIAMESSFERVGIPVRVLCAVEMKRVVEFFIREKAIKYLADKKVVIFAGGTGNPFFTTDTAASLRALEIKADIILKATKVDGVYDMDPVVHKDAVKFRRISYNEVLSRNLRVMDATAISLCRDNNLPVIVFNLGKEGNIKNAVCGKDVGTIVGAEP